MLLVSAFSCVNQTIINSYIQNHQSTTSEFSNMYLGFDIIYSFFHTNNKSNQTKSSTRNTKRSTNPQICAPKHSWADEGAAKDSPPEQIVQ